MTKSIKRTPAELILPRLEPIPGLRDDRNFMDRIMGEIADQQLHRRHARSFDRHRCPCPHCTRIG